MKKIKKKYIIVVVLVLLAITLLVRCTHHKHDQSNTNSLPPALVQLKNVEFTLLPDFVVSTGHLLASQQIDVNAQTSGTVSAVFFSAGQMVKSAQILVELDHHDSKAMLKIDQAKARSTQAQYERNLMLFKRGFITQETVYESKTVNQQNQAQLILDKIKLDNETIQAPFSGMMSTSQVSQGQYIQAGQVISTLVDANPLTAEYTLPSRDLSKIHLQQAVEIHSQDMPGKILKGHVTYISPLVDSDTQTVTVRARIDNSKYLLKPGQLVTVKQILDQQKRVVLLPNEAVLASIDGYQVFTIKDNKAQTTPIHIGEHINEKTVVIDGLKSGDQVVVTGQDQLTPGRPVKVVVPTAPAKK